MNVKVFCPACEELAPLPELRRKPWPCPHCEQFLVPTPAAGAETEAGLLTCRHCGHGELYTQKDFPHWLGLSILIAAVVASFIAYSYYAIFWTWVILIGSAAVDGLLYWWVGNVVVCYRCLAQHRGFPPHPGHRPFDLAVGEKYRQERLRRKQPQPAGEPPAP